MNEKPSWVLITGGTRGIGKGIVECLSEAGLTTVFTYKQSSAEAIAIEQDARARGLSSKGFQCDGSDATSVEELVSSLVGEHGAPLALINNAGITADSLMYSMPVEAWDRVVDANLKSSFLFSKAVLPSMMAARNGVILNMSSVAAIKGNIGQSNYSSTKAGLLGMTRSLALETGRFNVRVNAVLPGLVDTEMISKIPEKERAAVEKRIPLRRLCRVAEIGRFVKYLISDDASYITGQAFSIDGGLSA